MTGRGRHAPRVITEAMLLVLYKLYPRRLGKTLGMRKAMAQIRTPEAYAELKLAIENYRKVIEAEGRDKQFIMYFSTFMNQWQDYLEEEVMAEAKVLDLSDVFGRKA